ncbi:MAG TPA: hypothetical protein VGH32_00560 [Pirellulales bacterium]
MEADLSLFVKQYARPAQKGHRHDPNDRRYDRRIEQIIKRVPPDELDRLMRGDDG